ncbi:MAG: tRNA uridine-5-carboxymethylaminomethyl(34) synthesis GTPase MnmE [Gemmatimonadales bacterium]|nr:MAG: tRNA uridine-5-carboxymethylaminomethyl(34) synthesis GTPase MnmE [Gemmatimonadales bacterium]
MDPDTIVAVATPPGPGGIGVVRISGAKADVVLGRLAPEAPLPEPRRASLRAICDPESGELLDRALVTRFPGPASFTGEDVVEISTHGGALVPRLVEDAARRAGARWAEPGEFSRRAWLNGKLDLAQVEALKAVIEARSPAAHRVAIHQLDGALSRRIAGLREALIGLEATLAHHIDFPEEDDAPIPVAEIGRRGRGLAGELAALLEVAPEGMLLRDGAVVVLAGAPNAGKSSLFNALAGEARAIVTPEPGTTRDALEVALSIRGFPFRLVDTAGVRAGAQGVEREGIEVARRALAGARCVLLCVPVGEDAGPEVEGFVEGLEVPVLRVRTKADRVAGDGSARDRAGATGRSGDGGADRIEALTVSAETGQGLGELRDRLAELAFGGLLGDGAPDPSGVVMQERQRRGIGAAAREVEAFARALDEGVPPEAASAHLGEAATALEGVVGVIDPEEVLDRLFASFCIGK